MKHTLLSPVRLLERMINRIKHIGLNYDEAKVPAYSLPDPLTIMTNGNKVSTPVEWHECRRPELLRLFQKHVYGFSPQAVGPAVFRQSSRERNALQGLATRKEITINFSGHPEDISIHILLYVPNYAPKPVPAFLGLNFKGNHTIHPDAGISLLKQWQQPYRYASPRQILPPLVTRGINRSRWPVEKILERGYAIATAYYGEIEPDFPGGWRYGIRSIFRFQSKDSNKTQGFRPSLSAFRFGSRPAPPWSSSDQWGAIGAWAWGISRIMDYLESDSDILSSQVMLFGHSRLGKTALWAGAQDERFAMVIANNSGGGGAALSRRRFGETVKLLNGVNPHWFCGNFKRYNGTEEELPIDQHMLIGLVAPRPIYIASASEDLGADPRGEFLSARHADPVYSLFGLTGLGVEQMPGMNKTVGDMIGYHVRAGRHDLTDYDWAQFLGFAGRHFGRKKELLLKVA